MDRFTARTLDGVAVRIESVISSPIFLLDMECGQKYIIL